MKKYLLIPFDEMTDIGEGEVLVTFNLIDNFQQNLAMRGEDFDKWLRNVEPKAPPRPLSREERMSRALKNMRGEGGEPVGKPVPPQGKSDVYLRDPPQSKEPSYTADPRQPPSVEEDIESLGLRVNRVDPTDKIIKINNSAGEDGNNLTPQRAVSLVKLMTHGDPQVKVAAFNKLCGATLAQLLQVRKLIPDEIAMRITAERIKELGSDRNGVGSNFVPMDWSTFLQGVDIQGQAMEAVSTQVTIEPHRPPADSFKQEDYDMLETIQHNRSNLSTLETRLKSSTFSGNIPLSGGE